MQPLSFPEKAQYYVLRPILNTLLTAGEITAFACRLLNQAIEGRYSDIPLTICLANIRWLEDRDSYGALIGKVSLVAAKYFRKGRETTESCQECLPRLPVPNLWQTIQKWSKDLSARVDNKTLKDKKLIAQNFFYREGWKLQFLLRLKSLVQTNWLEDIWETGAYLMDRSPLPLSTNCFGVDSIRGATNAYDNPRIDRIARILWLAMREQRIVLDGQRPLLPEEMRGDVPICHGYDKSVVGNTRIPQKITEENPLGDRVEIHPESTGIAVLVNGRCFIIDGADEDGQPLSEGALRVQLERAVEEGECSEGSYVTVLSGKNRDEWADDHDLLMQNEINQKSLRLLETAAVVVTFEDEEARDAQKECELAAKGVDNRYWDKSLQLIVTPGGKILSSVTHQSYDASVPFYLWDILLEKEEYRDGESEAVTLQAKAANDATREPTCLEWDLSIDQLNAIDVARAELDIALNNVDVHHLHIEFPREKIKEAGMSPDSFIQMVLQLTYHKAYEGEQALTYESGTTRAFSHGRTETIRSSTLAARRMCEVFGNEGQFDESRKSVFREAVADHAKQKEACVMGGGIDRHILGLYTIAKVARSFAVGRWLLGQEEHPLLSDEHFDPSKVSLTFRDATSKPYTKFLGGGFLPVIEEGNGFCYYDRKEESALDCYITTLTNKSPVTSKELADIFENTLLTCSALFEMCERGDEEAAGVA